MFYWKILEIIKNRPENYETLEDGIMKKFWVMPRKFPHAQIFNEKTQNHLEFIISFIKIFSQSLKIQQLVNIDFKIMNDVSEKLLKNDFAKKIYDGENDSDLERLLLIKNEKIKSIFILIFPSRTFLEIMGTKQIEKLNIRRFEKDDEEILNFIHSYAKLMSENYDIEPLEKNETHRISGKIIPAVISSTSFICGLIFTEYIKYIKTKDIQFLRNSNVIMDGLVDLPAYSFSLTKVDPPRKLGSINYKSKAKLQANLTEWDIIIIKGPKTGEQLVKYVENTLSCNINVLFLDGIVIYDENVFKEEYELIKPLSGLTEFQKNIYIKREKEKKNKAKESIMNIFSNPLENFFDNKAKGTGKLKIKAFYKEGIISNCYYEVSLN